MIWFNFVTPCKWPRFFFQNSARIVEKFGSHRLCLIRNEIKYKLLMIIFVSGQKKQMPTDFFKHLSRIQITKAAIVDFVFLGPSQNPQLHYSEVNLPNEIDVFTSDEQRCFSQERVYWPPDGSCYPLLQQGPCRIGEWLVVSETISSRLVSFNSLICKSKFMKRKYSWHFSYYYWENLFDQNLKFKNKIHTYARF